MTTVCKTPGCEAPAVAEEIFLEAIDGGLWWPAERCWDHLGERYREQIELRRRLRRLRQELEAGR
jgi:hypothetical protein